MYELLHKLPKNLTLTILGSYKTKIFPENHENAWILMMSTHPATQKANSVLKHSKQKPIYLALWVCLQPFVQDYLKEQNLFLTKLKYLKDNLLLKVTVRATATKTQVWYISKEIIFHILASTTKLVLKIILHFLTKNSSKFSKVIISVVSMLFEVNKN